MYHKGKREAKNTHLEKTNRWSELAEVAGTAESVALLQEIVKATPDGQVRGREREGEKRNETVVPNRAVCICRDA